MINFTYTKANGEVTDRQAVVLKDPRVNFLTADVADLEKSTVKYIESWLKTHREQEKEFLENIPGLKYRTFKPENMTNIC